MNLEVREGSRVIVSYAWNVEASELHCYSSIMHPQKPHDSASLIERQLKLSLEDGADQVSLRAEPSSHKGGVKQGCL